MGTKDLTHEEIARALTSGEPLTHEQRSVLLGLVADDKMWQRKHDEMAEQLASAERKPLTDEQIERGREATFSTSNPFCPCDSKTMRKAVRWAEHAHGIKA